MFVSPLPLPKNVGAVIELAQEIAPVKSEVEPMERLLVDLR
jgi:hypothetical protein